MARKKHQLKPINALVKRVMDSATDNYMPWEIILECLTIRDLIVLKNLNRWFKKEVMSEEALRCRKVFIYSQYLSYKLATRFIKQFPGAEEMVIRHSKNALSTQEVRKVLLMMSSPLKRLKLIDQSQVDIGKLVYVESGLKDCLNVDLSQLEALEIIHYNSNLLNERSLMQITKEASKLHTVNLTNVETFMGADMRNKILHTLFACENIQNNLKKLVLLQNPGIDNAIFGKEYI